MDSKKHNRNVNLLCPTCGSDQFKFEDDGEEIKSIICVSCDREFSKDELIEDNSENISEHVTETPNDITTDITKEMRDTLKKAFRGSKNIKFK